MSFPDFRPVIVDALEVMRKKEVADKQPFKARAYAKVIKQIQERPTPITSYEDVRGMDGIGEKISAKIKELLATGSLQAAERAKATHNLDAYDVLQQIYGVGPAKARDLIAMGIQSVEALRVAVAKTPGLLTANQHVGLQYYEALLERIPRAEMLRHNEVLRSHVPALFEMELVGSFRRQLASSGDIDVLLRLPEDVPERVSIKAFRDYVATLEKAKYIRNILALGDKKCMAVCEVEPGKFRRLDLLMTPAPEYAYAILYFTGSGPFNVAFRQHAADRGFKLNEHGLVSLKGSPVPPMCTEADIFAFLGLAYVEPQYRVDRGQVCPL
jgi:DNA polymerase/3'-5' exonuclease PolX